MPTYVCSVRPNLLSADQKTAVARAITRRHSEATGAPAFFVQVVIDESAGSRFLGGSPADGPVWIRGDIRAGRPESVRQALMLAIMRDIAEIAGIRQSEVWVYLCNLAPTDMIEYGHILPAPGAERAWFDALPDELKAHLEGLGTGRADFTL